LKHKLKPCPFCGKEYGKLSEFYAEDHTVVAVRCVFCGATGAWFPVDQRQSNENAVKEWNIRNGNSF